MSSPSPPPHEGAGAKRPRPEVKVSVIDHTYRDFSRTSIEDLRVPENRTVPGAGGPRVNAELFPAKLHQILSNPEYYKIVRWKPHGRAWSVENRELLERVVIPKHFSMRDVKSFYRSVNGWGFKRLYSAGPDQNAYYHELFLRGKIELTMAMSRPVNPGRRLPKSRTGLRRSNSD
ncbi:hypothetical protein ACHAXT_013148 [Thalassiosira profunda]